MASGDRRDTDQQQPRREAREPSREERLARALRDNLRRRKAKKD